MPKGCRPPRRPGDNCNPPRPVGPHDSLSGLWGVSAPRVWGAGGSTGFATPPGAQRAADASVASSRAGACD
eukprot:2915596-Alexandrium_andersonii.AAC.1